MAAWLPRHYSLLLAQAAPWGFLLAHDVTQQALGNPGLPWIGFLGVSQLLLSSGFMLGFRPTTWRGALSAHAAGLALSLLIATLVR